MGRAQKRKSRAVLENKGGVPGVLGLSDRRWGFLAVIVYVLVGFVLYSNVLHGPFVFDDERNILDNPHIRVNELRLDELRDAGFESLCPNRPVANISFALNYYAHGYDVVGYHVVNILIHILTAIFLYFLVKATLEILAKRSPGDSDGEAYSAPVLAFCAVLIWLVHPVQTQSVSYIVQRMASLAGMFYVLSLLLYVEGRLALGSRKWLLFVGSAVSGVLALGSKEIAATLPFFVFLYEWYFFQDLSRQWLKHRVIPLVIVLVVVGVLGLVYTGGNPIGWVLGSYPSRDFTLAHRVMTEFRVVVWYISLLLFPHPTRLNLDYDFPVSYSLVEPFTTLLSLGVIVFLVAVSVYLAKRHRLLSFCILWFLGNLVIESSVLGLELVYEHRLYAPTMFAVVLVVVMAARYVRPRWAAVGLLCIVAGVFSVWTYQRNSLWADELALWQDVVKKSPNKARPHNNLGIVLYDLEKTDEAIGHYLRAVQIRPDYVEAMNNLGNALYTKGNLSGSITYLSRVLQLKPDCAKANNNIANALAAQGRIDEAINHYIKALKVNPKILDAYNGLGVALVMKGDIEGAIEHFREALRLDPSHAGVRANLERVEAMRNGFVD